MGQCNKIVLPAGSVDSVDETPAGQERVQGYTIWLLVTA